MKGSEIIAYWESARESVESARAPAGGSLGNRIRGKYDITYDGYSVCDFNEKGVELKFSADCCGHPWEIEKCVRLPTDDRFATRIEEIDPEKEYDIPLHFSEAEKLERGDLNPECFRVRDEGGRSISRTAYFDTFDQADERARRWAKENIERIKCDPSVRRYVSNCVCDDVQRARDKFEFRHYEYYCYNDYRYWVSVSQAWNSERR